jgi:serine/threonine-protein kinase RsbW
MILLSFPSTYESVEKVLDTVQQFATDEDLDDEVAHNMALLATEAATNAVEHGNREDASKAIHLSIEKNDEAYVISVADEGEGFDPAFTPDPLEEVNLFASGGRGVFLMRELADDVQFSDGGRRVSLFFRR